MDYELYYGHYEGYGEIDDAYAKQLEEQLGEDVEERECH